MSNLPPIQVSESKPYAFTKGLITGIVGSALLLGLAEIYWSRHSTIKTPRLDESDITAAIQRMNDKLTRLERPCPTEVRDGTAREE